MKKDRKNMMNEEQHAEILGVEEETGMIEVILDHLEGMIHHIRIEDIGRHRHTRTEDVTRLPKSEDTDQMVDMGIVIRIIEDAKVVTETVIGMKDTGIVAEIAIEVLVTVIVTERIMMLIEREVMAGIERHIGHLHLHLLGRDLLEIRIVEPALHHLHGIHIVRGPLHQGTVAQDIVPNLVIAKL